MSSIFVGGAVMAFWSYNKNHPAYPLSHPACLPNVGRLANHILCHCPSFYPLYTMRIEKGAKIFQDLSK
jgi:hypothetical protein